MPDADPPWYVRFFESDYWDIYAFTDEQTHQETAFARRVLGLMPGDRILDLACGRGRHAIPLAQGGLLVTGLDLQEEHLSAAADAAKAAGVPLETVHADMRQIPFSGRFDAVLSMFTSFGYLESEEEDQKVLAAISKALKPGGRLLIDLLNRDWVVRNYVQNEWRETPEGRLVLEHRDFDLMTSRMRVRYIMVEADGRRHESPGHDARLYTLTELAAMLTEAGLAASAAYGGHGGEPLSLGSRRMIVVARKP